MPVYPYRCGSDHAWDVVAPMREHAMRRRCPKCGGWGQRDISQLHVKGHAEDSFRPYWSEAMGRGWVNENTPEPGLRGQRYDAEGRLYVSSRSHLKKLKKLTGNTERKSYTE